MGNEFVRVPYYVEKDASKTFFLPACRTKGGYRVGPKGSEEVFSDYWEALERVSSMRPPRFRRSNSEGNFGIVTCELDALEDVRLDFIEKERNLHGG
jgi:hypothetical protein